MVKSVVEKCCRELFIEGRCVHDSLSWSEAVEQDFIDKDPQEQKPAIDAEDKALNKAVSEGLACNPSSELASFAAEIQESEDVSAEEAVKEAALNVTSVSGTVECEASASTTTELNVRAPNPGLDPDLLAALSQQWLEMAPQHL